MTRGDWGVSDIAWHPGRPDRRLRRRPRPGAGSRPANDDLGRRRRRAAAASEAEPREVLARSRLGQPPCLVAGRPLAGGDRRPGAGAARRHQPRHRPRPRRRQRPPHDARPGARPRRSATGPTPTSTAGWSAAATVRPGVDDRRIVATVSDRGRSHPHVYTIDPTTGRTGRPDRWPSTGDAHDRTRWPSRRDAGRRAAADRLPGTDGARAMELYTTDGPDPGATRAAGRRSAPPGRTATRCPRCAASRRPGAGGPDRDAGSPPRPAPGTRPLPTVVDVHGGPLGAWAPAPHIEVLLLAAAGYRVVLPNIRGSAIVRPRLDPAAARRLGRGRCRRRPRRARPCRRARPRRPGATRRHGPELRRVHGQLAGRHDRTGSRPPSRRTASPTRSPTGPTPTAAPNTTARRCSATRSAPRASTSSGASRRCATSRPSRRRC